MSKQIIYSLSVILLAAGCLSQPVQAQLIVGYDYNGAVSINTSGIVPDLAADPANAQLRPGAAVINDAVRGDALHVSGNGYGAWTPYAVKLEGTTTTLTIAYWIKTSAGAPNAWQGTVAYGGLSGGPRMFNHWGLGALGALSLNGGDTWNPINIGPGDPPGPGGLWHHVAMVLDNGILYGYWDGIQYGPITRSGLILLSNSGQPFTVGGFTNSSGNDGGNPSPTLTMYDDVGYWKGAAAPADIQGLFDGTYNLTNVPINDSGSGFNLPPGDIDENGVVSKGDVLLLNEKWLTDCLINDCGNVELTGDDDINMFDFSVISANWLAGFGPCFAAENLFGVPNFQLDASSWVTKPSYDVEYPNPPTVTQFTAAGTELYDCIAFFAGNDYRWGAGYLPWVGTAPDVFDYSLFDQLMGQILGEDPDALVMPRLSVGTPDWWLNDPANAGELEIMDDGSTQSTLYTQYGSNPGVLPDAGPFPSLASQKWRNDMAFALEQFIDYMFKRGYGQHIVGFKLMSLDTNEWYHWSSGRNELSGYSVPTRNAFREWLRDNYNDDVSALRTAWNNPTVTFDNAQVPSRSSRLAGEGSRTFRDIPLYRNVVDWYQFYNELIPDTVDFFAEVIKRKTEGKKAVGSFYGFMNEFEGISEFGHNALGRYLQSPNLDFVLVTASYTDRDFITGGDNYRSPYTSVALHNKVWLHDNDMATFVSVTDIWPNTFGWDAGLIANETHRLGGTTNAADTIQMMRRAFGFATCSGVYSNYFDLHNGTYSDQSLMAEVANLNAFRDRVKNYDTASLAEVLVVYDEVSTHYAPRYSQLSRYSLRESMSDFTKFGSSVDQVLVDDLGLIDPSRYKLVVFMNCWNLTTTQRTLIDGMKANNRVMVFCYAPGYFNGSSLSEANMESLVGMNLTVSSVETLRQPRVQVQNDHALGQALLNAGIGTFGPSANIAKRIWVDDVTTSRLGRDPSFTSHETMAIKDMGSWESIYCVTADMTPTVVRELARYAGAHIYSETDDTFYVNNSYACLHANGTGSRTIQFPQPVDVYDALTEVPLATNVTSYTTTYTNGETRIFRYEPNP